MPSSVEGEILMDMGRLVREPCAGEKMLCESRLPV